MRKYIYVLLFSAAVAACTPAPKEAYFNRGEPESLLDISTETVNIKLISPTSVQKIVNVINKEQPTRARVSCLESSSLCKEARSVMNQFKVPVVYHATRANVVTIVYERILTRNCQNRFIDNPGDMNNLNYPTLGCSTALNIVQMVTDKHQFIDPPLMDDTDSNKPMQALTNYDVPSRADPTSFQPMVEGASGGTGR